MEILLAYKAHEIGSRDPYTSLLPIGLGSINALLRAKGYSSKIANLSRYSWRETASLIASESPDVLGVSQFTHNRTESLKLARMAKIANPLCFVVFGGPHATHRFSEILSQNPAVDAVVLGEGEETFCELVDCLLRRSNPDLQAIKGIAFRSNGAIVTTAPRPPLNNLDNLPFPAACLDNALGVAAHQQLEFLITSRGCPASCSFCSSPKFWGKVLRFRSPRSMVEEIRFIRNRYGLLYFSIRDDTFTADRERVLEFCRLLIQEKLYILWSCQSRVNAVDEEILFWMKRAGCECIQFGVESASLKVLKYLGKGITPDEVKGAARATRRVGINLSIYLITGVPGETEEDLNKTLALLDMIKAHDGQISPLAYYPGTRIFENGVRSGVVAADLFETDRREALYVRSDPAVARSTKALLERLTLTAGKNAFSPTDFSNQQKLLGYCYATNIMAGEQYESGSKCVKAEAEYREIIVKEPENPWGLLLIGELYARNGNFVGARRAFENLIRLVPAHAMGYSCLGELYRMSGDYRAAGEFYRQAHKLDPFEKIAAEGLDVIGA
jgi:anaerobic magnesium-protoporphyrin IX monomethyl ester cyclase